MIFYSHQHIIPRRNEYFSELLKRIVITVMLRILPPHHGANIVHSCATILGLVLLKKPPNTTLVIHGMRKTNTLKQGYNFIVKAFQRFGEIEEAAIAPNNHGFGKYIEKEGFVYHSIHKC